MSTQTYAGTLTVLDCPNCGITFGITAEYEQRRRGDHQSFHCPSGHSMSYGATTEADRLRREVERQRAAAEYERGRAERLQESAEGARRSAAAIRGVVTRIKRRVAKGVCPCCNRHFADLHRHMQGQHPTWDGESAS